LSAASVYRMAYMIRLVRGVSKVLFQQQDEGQGVVEYALVLVLIAVVVIAVYLLLEPAIASVISDIKSSL
jgi:pilus assembly protein Flp/PilA